MTAKEKWELRGMNKEYTLKELSHRSDLRSRRADLLIETLDLAARGLPEDYKRIDELDVEIERITKKLEIMKFIAITINLFLDGLGIVLTIIMLLKTESLLNMALGK